MPKWNIKPTWRKRNIVITERLEVNIRFIPEDVLRPTIKDFQIALKTRKGKEYTFSMVVISRENINKHVRLSGSITNQIIKENIIFIRHR